MSTLPVLLAAAAAGAAVGLAGRPRPSSPARRAAGPAPGATEGDRPGLLLRLRPVLVCFVFLAGWAFLGGAIGVVAGLAAAAMSWRVLGRAESPDARRRREQVARELPTAVRLLGSCLAAGASVQHSLGLVAEALPGPLGDEFSLLRHRLELGVDPAGLWAELGRHPQLAGLGRALGRAHQTGAPVTGVVAALADELRARTSAEVAQRAKSVDVLASAPLGACYLPAFVLLGVVPMVAGIFGSMQLFR